MPRKKTPIKSSPPRRLTIEDLASVSDFHPWWVRCSKCSLLAYLTPEWEKRKGKCACGSCGKLYKIDLSGDWPQLFPALPLWLKANFRGNTFWALNREHLLYMERIIQSPLREKPVTEGKRQPITTLMPFNLPSWILAAKNRPDLLKLVARLKTTIPPEIADHPPKIIETVGHRMAAYHRQLAGR